MFKRLYESIENKYISQLLNACEKYQTIDINLQVFLHKSSIDPGSYIDCDDDINDDEQEEEQEEEQEQEQEQE